MHAILLPRLDVCRDFGTRWINPEPLDKGGQAQTFLVSHAEEPKGPRRVAKLLSNPREERKLRFLQEIEVTETFDHPNVVRSLGRGETTKSKWPYFVMPYYELGTLEKNHEHLGSPLHLLRIFLAICKGVGYAHSKALIHRDLKSANIFMAQPVLPVVGDFGLCYRADEDQDGRNTQTSEAVGARKYMPPEWREGRHDRPSATGDIYSLGKILYWMFKGTSMTDMRTTTQVIIRLLGQEQSSLANRVPRKRGRWLTRSRRN